MELPVASPEAEARPETEGEAHTLRAAVPLGNVEGLPVRVAVLEAQPDSDGVAEPLRYGDALPLPVACALLIADAVLPVEALPTPLPLALTHAVPLPVLLLMGLPEGEEQTEGLADGEGVGVAEAQGGVEGVALGRREGEGAPVKDLHTVPLREAPADTVTKPLPVAAPEPLPLPLPRVEREGALLREALPVSEGGADAHTDTLGEGLAPPVFVPLRDPLALPLRRSDRDGEPVADGDALDALLPLAQPDAEALSVGEREIAALAEGRAERVSWEALADAVGDGERDAERV